MQSLWSPEEVGEHWSPSPCGATNWTSTARGCGCVASRAGCPSSSRSPATNCAPSSVTLRRAPMRCPGGRPPPHVAPFLRLRSCGQRTRFASDPGLSRPPRSPAHCPLHPHRRASFRGAVAMSARAGHDLSGIIKWCAREDWRPRVDAVMAEHFEPAMKAFGLDFQEIGETLGAATRIVTLWGCAFEDFLTRRFGSGDENAIEVYLRRRGWKESVTARTYMNA